MPKIKTNKSAKKRFKKTANGRIKRRHAFARHILTKKSRNRKRHLRKSGLVSHVEERRIKLMIPY